MYDMALDKWLGILEEISIPKSEFILGSALYPRLESEHPCFGSSAGVLLQASLGYMAVGRRAGPMFWMLVGRGTM